MYKYTKDTAGSGKEIILKGPKTNDEYLNIHCLMFCWREILFQEFTNMVIFSTQFLQSAGYLNTFTSTLIS